MLKDHISYAIKNILHRKLRSWLTIIGIIIGVAAVVSLISLGQGLQNAINTQFSSLGTDKITITPSGGGIGVPGSYAVAPLTEHDVKLIKNIPGVEVVAPRIIKKSIVKFNKKEKSLYATSVPKDKSAREMLYNTINFEVEDGRLLNENDKWKVVLGNKFSKDDIFGKPVKKGDTIEIQDKDFRVIGILKPSGTFQIDGAILMTEDSIKELFGKKDEFNILVVKIDPTADINEISKTIEKTLRKDRGLKIGEENFEVSTPQKMLKSASDILLIVQAIIIGIAGISLLVGAIGILNTMYTSVLERTNEIGVMKAIGAKNTDIFTLFLIESGSIGLVGGIIGILIGIGIGKLVELGSSVAFGTNLIQSHTSITLIIGVLIFSLIVGILSGLTPAMRASKMNPVDSLRYE